MSYPYIAAVAVIACVALLLYGLISQSIEQKRREANRLIGAIGRHINLLQELHHGLPKGLLSPALYQFLLTELIHSHQQLLKLKPKHPHYVHALDILNQELQQRKETPAEKLQLSSVKEIKLSKVKLTGIGKVLASALKRQKITAISGKALETERQSALQQVNLHSYQYAAKAAIQAGKLPVAIHYYQQAKKSLMAIKTPQAQQQIAQLDKGIQSLNKKMAAQDASQNNEDQNTQAQSQQPIQQSDEELSIWHKKQVYD